MQHPPDEPVRNHSQPHGHQLRLQPAISYNFGAGNLKRMKQIIRSTAVFTVCLGTVLTILCYLGRSAIISAFVDNAEVFAYGRAFVFPSSSGPFTACTSSARPFCSPPERLLMPAWWR